MRLTHPVMGGVIVGVITLACYLAAYAVDPVHYRSRWLYWGSFIIYLIMMYLVTVAARDEGISSFRELVRAPFVTFLVANLIFYVFNDVMTQQVDTGIHDAMVQELMQQRDDVDKARYAYSLTGSLLAYFQSAIAGFVIAAFITYIVRTFRPS